MVKNPLVPVARTASLSARSAVRRARIGPGRRGRVAEPLEIGLGERAFPGEGLAGDEPGPVAVPRRPRSPRAAPRRSSARRLRRPPRTHATASVAAHDAPIASAAGVSAGLDAAGLRRLHDRLAAHTESGQVPGLVALVARGDDVHTEVLGHAGARRPGAAATRRHLPHRLADQADRRRGRHAPGGRRRAVALRSRSTSCCRSWPTGGCCAAWRARWTTRSRRHGPSRSRTC